MKKQLLLVCAGADEASTSSASPDILYPACGAAPLCEELKWNGL
jgi:hypothetical protein